ncbi:PEP-CTERM sorting domain-containing protein [Nostoc sphaeroides CHAB 2801]|uniref:PEP-CTERM sorting domain-containing protein n=1 Tax=Nostoc sphaeroides TaxID=446679 RepID=UPI000E47F2F2|nr:PEP-CTERM sorting domain-containing protein [Nostoc sphaeroides]MCC5630463.1 PEP-CTERM sorting domain-containing protein [Nostoc sphaeroides CHAB 2801]
MINLKSRLLNATLAITAAIPLATAGLFTSTGSAQAAALNGGFNYGSAGFPATTVTVSKTSLKFDPSPGLASLSLRSGHFTAFNAASIFNVTTNPLAAGSLFLDLGVFATPGTLTDGANTFRLTAFNTPTFSIQSAGTNVRVNYLGFFDDGAGNKTNAEGYITFVTQDTDAEGTYNSGKTFDATFTGLAVSTVPEPAALLGLGAVGAVMAMSRRRKSFAQ